MLRRVLLAALVCVAVWVSGYGSETLAVHATAGLNSFDGHAGNPVRSTDVWQSAGAVVTVQAGRLHVHPAEVPVATLALAPRARYAASPAHRRPPPATPHTFEPPLLI